MWHRLTIFTLCLIVALVAACGGNVNPGVQPENEAPATLRPTVTNVPAGQDGQGGNPYPIMPFTPTPDRGYLLPTPLSTINPYPDGFSWMVLPIGEQCAEPPPEVNLAAALLGLTEAGIDVQSSGLTAVPVCAACGCPTSNHYRALIPTDSIPEAESLGWTTEP